MLDPSVVGPTQPLLVFVNPKSGGNKGSKALHTLCWLLNPRQVFDITTLKGPKYGLEMFRKIATQMRILVAGGDGTVGWVLSTLDSLNWPTYPPMALLPLGTGNDLSRCMGWGGVFSDEPLAELLGAILTETSITYLDRWRLDVQPNTSINPAMSDSNNDDGSLNEAVQSSLPLTVMNNYFSIGADAHVALQFHHSRSANPQVLNSRFKNRIAYGGLGTIDLFKRTWKDLSEFIVVECDDVDISAKIRDSKFHCVLFHNISFYAGGTVPWGGDCGDEGYARPSCCDQLIEVIGFTTATLAALQMGAKGERIAQCSKVRIQSTKAIPMQVDGEPCMLAPSIIKLSFHSKVPMLKRDKKVLCTANHSRRTNGKGSRAGLDFASTSIFMHVPVIVVGRHDYDTYRDSIDRLKDTGFEIGVVSLEAEMELQQARYIIQKLLADHAMLPYEPGKEWRFLDYECIIILDDAFPSMTSRSAAIGHDLIFSPAKRNSRVPSPHGTGPQRSMLAKEDDFDVIDGLSSSSRRVSIVEGKDGEVEIILEKDEPVIFTIFEAANIDGVQHLSSKNRCTRYTWFLLILIFVCMCFYQIATQAIMFWFTPIATNIAAAYPASIPFPVVAIFHVTGAGPRNALKVLVNIERYERIESCTPKLRTSALPGLKILLLLVNSKILVAWAKKIGNFGFPSSSTTILQSSIFYMSATPEPVSYEVTYSKSRTAAIAPCGMPTIRISIVLNNMAFCNVHQYFGCAKEVLKWGFEGGFSSFKCKAPCDEVDYTAWQDMNELPSNIFPKLIDSNDDDDTEDEGLNEEVDDDLDQEHFRAQQLHNLLDKIDYKLLPVRFKTIGDVKRIYGDRAEEKLKELIKVEEILKRLHNLFSEDTFNHRLPKVLENRMERVLQKMNVEHWIQEPTYSVWSLFCDIGGALGLFLGASLLTIIEVAYFVVHNKIYKKLRFWKKDEQESDSESRGAKTSTGPSFSPGYSPIREEPSDTGLVLDVMDDRSLRDDTSSSTASAAPILFQHAKSNFIFVRLQHIYPTKTPGQYLKDEAVRLLLATADDAQALAGLSNGVSTHHRSSPEITFNLAVVLIISLLSVALLITVIIVIAIAMDSRAEKDHEIESGTASTSESPRRDMDFGYNSDEENEKEHPADMDVSHWANSVI
ncbi:diacylglycerol kinase accessory domain-containing protein [Ditylenchus destructor]|nr:diacylglycerol kinase accessory domain-containing protein [Ditylenchus destructor]